MILVEVQAMPKQMTKGKAQLATQVRADVLEAFKEYVKRRGETLSAALERAMTRDMAYPPPETPPAPLPDGGPARSPARKKRGKSV
jgi:hypothetical protein